VEAVAAVSIPVGVVATGEFTSLDGVTAGSVVGSYDGDSFTFDFPDFATGEYPQVLLAFADAELGPDDCLDDRYQYAMAYAVGQDALHSPVFGPTEYGGDPSFFSTVAVLEYPEGPAEDGVCWQRTLAIATLTWTMPDLHPALVVADTGEGSGASGEVTTDSSGAPLTYLTASGDTWAAIAARFGISAEELLYLNPGRPIAYDPASAYAEELLNLSKELRGARL
jgi:hypothetical protein